jgi:psp operon transcriptional activator
VRELRNVVERAVYRWSDPYEQVTRVQFDPFASPWQPQPMPVNQRNKPPSSAAPDTPALTPGASAAAQPEGTVSIALDDICDFRIAVDSHEVAILTRALERNRYNQRATAKALGLSYDQLRHCLKKHGLL